jgi:hypothetical protein
MRFKQNSVLISAAVSLCGLTATAYAVDVGNNPAGASATVVVNSGPFGGSPSFTLSQSIMHVATAGNLFTDFTNTSQGGGGTGVPGISSGTNVPINETFTNTGADGWGGWTETVLTQTTLLGGGTVPGFLFDDLSPITVRRNGVLLTAGTDYTLITTPFPDGFGGGNNGYSSVTVSLAPSAFIQSGDNLNIQKQIHEVSGDANVWTINEAARVAQFPTAVPEPGTGVLLFGAVFAMRASSRRRIRPA